MNDFIIRLEDGLELRFEPNPLVGNLQASNHKKSKDISESNNDEPTEVK